MEGVVYKVWFKWRKRAEMSLERICACNGVKVVVSAQGIVEGAAAGECNSEVLTAGVGDGTMAVCFLFLRGTAGREGGTTPAA